MARDWGGQFWANQRCAGVVRALAELLRLASRTPCVLGPTALVTRLCLSTCSRLFLPCSRPRCSLCSAVPASCPVGVCGADSESDTAVLVNVLAHVPDAASDSALAAAAAAPGLGLGAAAAGAAGCIRPRLYRLRLPQPLGGRHGHGHKPVFQVARLCRSAQARGDPASTQAVRQRALQQ